MRFQGNDAGGHRVEDDAVTTKKLADNAVSYLITTDAVSVDITTHGSIENPTTLIAIAKGAVYEDATLAYVALFLALDGDNLDTAANQFAHVPEPIDSYHNLVAQFMIPITDSDSHTISVSVSTLSGLVGNFILTALEIRR